MFLAGELVFSATGNTYQVHVWPTLAAKGKPRVGVGDLMVVAADGTRIAIASCTDEVVEVRDVASEKLLFTLPVSATSMAFSPDGKRLAIGVFEGFRLYDLATRKVLHSFRDPAWRIVPSIAYAPDGARIATRSYDDVSIWDTTTGKRVGHIEVNDDPEPVAFLPDGSLVTAVDESTLGLWKPRGWAKPARTAAKRKLLGGIAALADGTFVTNGRDDGVRKWTATLEPKVIAKASWQANGIAISGDGRRLVAAVSDSILVWSEAAVRSSKRVTAIAPEVATQIKGARTIDVTTAKQLAAWIAKTSWLANVGKPFVAKDASRLASLAAWKGPDQPTNEAIFTLPHELVEDATLAATQTGKKSVISTGAKAYRTVFARARKAVPFPDDADISDPPNAAVLSAATTAQAAAMWLALGWKLPADLMTLLAWYGDGRWPCGFTTPAKRGGTPLAVI
ncbi:MAG: WD40 repeat domain-containing protein [Proteobacteria bacterium]|nr:WD40 repeat domain-containing protein [Pseudomonadota bacterium]